VAVQRIVGGVEIENDLFRRRRVRLQEQRHEQPFHRRRIMADPVIPRRRLPAQLEPVERRLAGHRRTVLAPRSQLARQHRHDRIVPQLIMVVDVLISQRNPEHPLPNQGRRQMLDQFPFAPVHEAGGKAINQPDRTIRRSQQQRPGIRCDRSTIKSRHNGAAFHRCKLEQFCATLCRHRGAPRIGAKLLSHNHFR
jgi:hypothetical protein